MAEERTIQTETWLYSFSKTGWFSPSYNIEIPDDAVPVGLENMIALKAGVTAGQVIVPGEDGEPVLGEPPPPSPEVLGTIERRWRDFQLSATDPLVTRHRDELELELPTTLNAEQYQQLQQYRVALRFWPESADFPTQVDRPQPPNWLADL